MDLIQHTEFHGANFLLDTQWGEIPYLQWLKNEAERIREHGAEAEIRQQSKYGTMIALFVEPDTRNQ